MVSAVRESLTPTQRYNWHKGLGVNSFGLTTNLILKNIATPEQTFEVIIDLEGQRLIIESNFWDTMRLSLSGQSLNALCDETCSLLSEMGVTMIKRQMFSDGKRGKFDPEFVKHYWEALKSSYNALSDFRGELPGLKSPVQLWHERFNLSFFWYPESLSNSIVNTEDKIEFGFSTGDEIIPDAYLFVKSPEAESADPASVKNMINDKVKNGLILLYKDLLGSINPGEKLLNFFRAFRYSYA
jgi:hypothetical protein